jgi:hypothetical protein
MTEAGRDFTLGMQALSRSLTISQMWLRLAECALAR